jgi:hypothetical protein
MAAVPAYYSDKKIYHWSQTKARCSLGWLICEYMYRQPAERAAYKALKAGDLAAQQTIDHYAKPANISMDAGSAIHEAAFKAANGTSTISQAFRDILPDLQAHKPASWLPRDAKLTDYLLSEDGDRISKTLEHAVEGINVAFKGANEITSEEKFSIDLPGIEIPTIGYCDGRGGGVIGELKTKFDAVRENTKAGFGLNSLPPAGKPPPYNDIQQVALYRHAYGGGQAKLIYANRLGHRIFEISDEQCDAAVADLTLALRKRQSILQRCDTISDLIAVVEADWTDFRWNDLRPELLADMKTFLSGGWEI